MSLSIEENNKNKTIKQTRANISVVDMHLHFVDFLQNTDGYKALLKSMKKGNISHNVVFGLPVKKKWEYFEAREPHYYLGDNSKCIYYNATDELVASGYLELKKKLRNKIAPTLCGFDPTDMACIDYIEMMFEKYDIWKGIGELLLRHDDLTNLTQGEIARANHPALDKVYEFCAKKNIPVCLHQNSTSVASSVSSYYNDDYEYIDELTQSLRKYKDTTFVWAHCGVSRRVDHPNYHEMVEGMLNMYHNLHVDLSWIVFEDTICKNDTKFTPKTQWLDLIEKYQDRIMIGSDLCGHFDTHGQTMSKYNTLFKKLSSEASVKVASQNAKNLYFK